MKKNLYLLIMLLIVPGILSAKFKTTHHTNIRPITATKFEVTDINHEHPKIVDLSGKNFILVSVREPGSDGEVYAVDSDGTIWWHGRISSGAPGHETHNGIFHVLLKRRFHMSSKYPDPRGIDNMDFELQFTPDGQALHLGNNRAYSHGCIHVPRQDISAVFKWAEVGTTVVVMRGHYRQFLTEEVDEFTRDVAEYDRMMGISGDY